MKNIYFITGAAGGLGKAFAVECASRGWDLFLTDLAQDRLAMIARGLERPYGVKARYYAADLTDAASRQVLFSYIREAGIKFQGLVNVAGLDHEGMFLDRKPEEIAAIVRLNVEATLMVTHGMLEFRSPRTPFRIINVSSLAAFFSMPVKATYAASKRFLLDFSLALRNELRDQQVSVTVLCPAGLPTTDECISAIEAQGIIGQLTTQDIGKVAHETIQAALRGQAVVVPGLLNRIMLGLGSLVPPMGIAELVGSRWRAAHRRRAMEQG